MSRIQRLRVLKDVKQKLRECDGGALLQAHGYTLNDLDVTLDSEGALASINWPGAISSYVEAYKEHRLGALQGEVLGEVLK